MILILCFAMGFGVWMVSDGWYSLLVHWKRDGQTFWRDQIFRLLRSIGGLMLYFGMVYILLRVIK